jgi:hypothetical protein
MLCSVPPAVVEPFLVRLCTAPKMKSRVWTKWVAIFFLAVVFALVGAAFWVGRTQDAFSFPVQLRSRVSVTREFRVSAKAQYRIEIRCSRSMPFERLRKLLQGGNLVKIDLLQNGAPVYMSYFAEPQFRPGIVSTAEDGNLGFAQDWISQDIADFTGDPKNFYTITCSVIRPIEELTATHPTLFVALDPLEVEGRAVGTALLLAAALVCGLLSLIFGLVSLYLRRRRVSKNVRPVAAA